MHDRPARHLMLNAHEQLNQLSQPADSVWDTENRRPRRSSMAPTSTAATIQIGHVRASTRKENSRTTAATNAAKDHKGNMVNPRR